MDLAGQCISPGKMVNNHVFSEATKEHLVKRLCGISQREYKNQGWIQCLRNLFIKQGRKFWELMREIVVQSISDEDRKSPWIQMSE